MAHFNLWGTSIGFTTISASSPSVPSPDPGRDQSSSRSETTLHTARNSLSAISRALDGARDEGGLFRETAEVDETRVLNAKEQVEKATESIKALHMGLKRINSPRTPRSQPQDSAMTAMDGMAGITSAPGLCIYEKETLYTLLQTISTHIRRINDLFPSLSHEQASLASEEVRTIKNVSGTAILWLNEIIMSEDSFLGEVLSEEISNNRDTCTDIEVKEKFQGQFGSKFAKGVKAGRPTTWKKIVAGGEAKAQFGNIYGV
ncbi:hypothetical protein BDW67DRAFT_184749 [Aspergillus spinulosporus]